MYFSNDIWRGNMGTYHPNKEQACSRRNKDGKEYVKHHIPGHNQNIWVREKKKVTDVIEQVRRRKWTWTGHVIRIRDNRWTLRIVSPPGNPTKGKDLEEDRRDEDGDHWQYTIWQRIVQQDKQMYEN